ncbi:MAG: DUF167 domain-containing protein [Gammaproteobacteria bacterium]|nr:DUF167 domain-containing protein [Gammaproteobacteria bacterium]
MWYKITNQEIELKIFVKPNAKRTALLTINDEQGLVIALHAKPQDGEANTELIIFLAELLDLPKTKITLPRGAHSRHKKIKAPLNDRIKLLVADPLKFLKL